MDISLEMTFRNKSHTLPFENRKNIAVIALSPDSNVLISVDEGEIHWFCSIIIQNNACSADGRALLMNFRRAVVLHHFNFKKKVNAIKFSPDGK